MTNRQQGIRFVSNRSNRVESTTFSTHPQSPDALYLLSLAQIDFWYDESTARDTIRHDSIESCRIDNIFNPPSKHRCAIFTKSRANRLPVWRIDSKGHDSSRFDRIESNRQHFQPTLQSPDALYLLSLAQIDFQYDELTARDTIRVDSIESCRIDNIFNQPSKPRCAIFTKSRANRPPAWRIDSKRDDSCRFHQRGSSNRHPVGRIVKLKHESTLVGCIGQPSQIIGWRRHAALVYRVRL